MFPRLGHASPVADPLSDQENQRPTEQKKKLKLTYDEYKTMSNLIVYFMRKKEAEFEGMMFHVLHHPVQRRIKLCSDTLAEGAIGTRLTN